MPGGHAVDVEMVMVEPSPGQEKSVRMTDRTLIQTPSATCAHAGSYMVENIGPSVRTRI